MIVFDVTSSKSYEQVKKWAEIIYNNTTRDVIKFIVGNKSDLADQ